MMKKRKFGAGGPAKRPMPTPADRAAARAQDEMLKKVKVTKSEAATIASANRSEGGTHKKGGMIKKRYADGGMAGAAVDLEAAARRGENLRELDRMDFSVPKVEAPAKKQSFSAAFAAARKRGDKTFSWNGGSYGTKMAGEDSKSTKPAISGMSDAQIRKFMSDNDRAADAVSMSDAQIRKFMSDNDRAADRSLAATKAKKEAKMASDIGKATTASLSAAASRAIPRTPGMPMKSGAGKPAISGMSDAQIRKFMRDNERGYEETAARKLANPISRTAKATGTAAKPRLVEPKYAKGGSVSKRADGIATKGKTKGKVV